MGVVVLYKVDDRLAAAIRSTESLRNAEFVEVVHSGALRDMDIDVVVAGTTADPARAGREIRGHERIALVLCATATNEPQLRRSILFTPFLPADTTVVPVEPIDALQRSVAAAVERVRRSRALRSTFAMVNASLATAAPALAPELPYLDRLLDAAPLAILTANTSGTILSANSPSLRVLHAPPGSLIGAHVTEAFGEAGPEVMTLISGATSAPEPPARSLVTRTAGSEAQHLEMTAVRYSEAGSPAVLLIAQDVTERVNSAAALRESEWTVQLALAAGRMGTWRWDASTDRMTWSDSLAAIHGLGPGEFPGTLSAYLSFVHPDDRAHVQRYITGAARDSREYEFEYRIIRADGQLRWLANRGQALYGDSGERTGITGVTWDNTDRRAAESEKERLTRELQQTNAVLDALFENAPVGLGFWDLDLRYARVNAALAEINGIPAEEHIGKTVAELLPGLDAGVTEAFRSVMTTGTPIFNQEAHGATPAKPGEERYWNVSYYPVRSVSGAVMGAGAVCEEITARKRIEAEIAAALGRERAARAEAERAERRAAFLAEAATVLASSLDVNGALCNVARMAVSHIADWCAVDVTTPEGGITRVAVEHWNPEKVELGHKVQELYPVRDIDVVVRVIRTGKSALYPEIAAQLTQTAYDAEHLRLLRELGLRSFICVPIRRRENVMGAISFVAVESGATYDAADLRLAEELADRVAIAIENARLFEEAQHRRAEAEKAAEQLRRANHELESFAYIASHDLQEPLRTVASYAQLIGRLYRGKLDKDADEFIGYMVDGVKRMRTLIDDLLTYSRAARDEQAPAGVAKMEAVLNDVLSALSASIRESGAQITHDPLPDLEPANQRQMTQLLQNLISNAIKYRREGVAPSIHIGARHEDGVWHFSVRDNGQGFEQQYADQVFTIFKRLHGKEVPGTGIGLALCHRIVERHGGKIWAEAKPGEGATFHFTIPVQN